MLSIKKLVLKTSLVMLILFPPRLALADNVIVNTTLFPIYDMVKIIGGESVTINLLSSLQGDVHHFSLKPRDITAINNSDLFFYTNDPMEPWVKDELIPLVASPEKIINTSADITLQNNDPHLWLDFSLTQKMAMNIADHLAKADPHNKKSYLKRAKDYQKKLAKLDKDYQTALKNCRLKTIINTDHDNLGYLGRRYNLNIISFGGLSDESEPTAAEVQKAIETIKKENIPYIFYGNHGKKWAKTVADATQKPLLYINSANQQPKNNDSFIDIMQANLANLKKALDCK